MPGDGQKEDVTADLFSGAHVLPVRLSWHEREIQLWEAQTCTSPGLQRDVHATGQVDERSRQVERPP